jgi:hypothetical protein
MAQKINRSHRSAAGVARILMRACLTLAIVAGLSIAAFGHQAGMAKVDQAQALSYVLAGGDLADLCGDPFEGAQAERCLACVIAQGAPLLRPDSGAAQIAIAQDIIWPALPATFTPQACVATHQARAPPLV